MIVNVRSDLHPPHHSPSPLSRADLDGGRLAFGAGVYVRVPVGDTAGPSENRPRFVFPRPRTRALTGLVRGPTDRAVAHPATVCGPASSRTVWFAPAVKVGASFTGSTVRATVAGSARGPVVRPVGERVGPEVVGGRGVGEGAVRVQIERPARPVPGSRSTGPRRSESLARTPAAGTVRWCPRPWNTRRRRTPASFTGVTVRETTAVADPPCPSLARYVKASPAVVRRRRVRIRPVCVQRQGPVSGAGDDAGGQRSPSGSVSFPNTPGGDRQRLVLGNRVGIGFATGLSFTGVTVIATAAVSVPPFRRTPCR